MKRATVSSAALLFLGAGVASGQIAVGTPTNYNTPQRPDGIAAADFTGNGHRDLAVITDNQDKVSLLTNNGDGTFGGPQITLLGSGVGARKAAAGDLTGDGAPDLAVTLHNNNEVVVLTSSGGFFTIVGRAPVGLDARSVRIADFNGDLLNDMVVVNRDSNNVTVLLNLGGGTSFTSTNYATGTEPRDVAVGDFNGDLLPDLAVGDHDDRTVSVLLNNGSGGFPGRTTLSVGAQLRPEGVTVGDFNNDGLPDIAAATEGNGVSFASIFTNTGSGFSGPVNAPTNGQESSGIAAADLNGDQFDDLVVANEDSGNISILTNMGGGFGVPQLISTGVNPDDIALTTLDDNSSVDIAVTNRDSNTTTVILSLESPGCYADCDQSTGAGVLDIFDFLCFQDAFVGGDPYADCDGNSVFDVFDFLCFQDAFASGCV